MALAKPELGTKRTCVSCATRFYDLMKTPAVCPKCSTEQPVETPRARRASAADRAGRRAVPVPVEAVELPGVEVEVPDAAVEEDGIEDAEDLEADEADLGEDIAVEDEDDDVAR